MRTFLLRLMRNDSEVATITVDLWCKRFTGKIHWKDSLERFTGKIHWKFTGKSSTVLQLSFHNGIFFFTARLTNNILLHQFSTQNKTSESSEFRKTCVLFRCA